MDTILIHESMGTVIIIKHINTKKFRTIFHKGIYKDMRKYLVKVDWNNILKNKTTVECLYIIKYETESIIEQFLNLKKYKENGLERNTCQKKLLEK